MFNNQKNLNVACPRCKSENIYIGNNFNIKNDDTIQCNDCKYRQLVFRFKDQWKIENYKRKP